MANVLIIGGGFGGLMAAERLVRGLGPSHQVTVVSPNRKFTFYPGLVQLAFGEIEQEDISFDLGARFKDLGVRHILGELIHLNPERRKIDIAGDEFSGELGYDYLVLAPGRRLATEKIPGFFEHANHLLGAGAALRFGAALNHFREGTIVLGSCPGSRLPVPVCETAFAVARKFTAEINDGRVRVKVVFPRSVREAFGGADLHTELEAAFARHGINVLYDVPIAEITEDEIVSTEKHRIKYDLLMLIPPFRGQAILNDLGALDDDDFIKVDGLMRVQGRENIYAVGDVVAFSGPKFAHMAVRQGNVAAENIISELTGEEPESEYYHEIATVIDAGGPESIYLHYGIWDDALYRLKKGRFWSVAKNAHDAFWRMRHS
jgi:sulfide:quinone oxidoreductase